MVRKHAARARHPPHKQFLISPIATSSLAALPTTDASPTHPAENIAEEDDEDEDYSNDG